MSLNDNTSKIASVLAKVNALPAQLDTSDATAAAEAYRTIIRNARAYNPDARIVGGDVPVLVGRVFGQPVQEPRAVLTVHDVRP